MKEIHSFYFTNFPDRLSSENSYQVFQKRTLVKKTSVKDDIVSGNSKEEDSLNLACALDHCNKFLLKEDDPRLMWLALCLVDILKHTVSFDFVCKNLVIVGFSLISRSQSLVYTLSLELGILVGSISPSVL